MSNTLRDILLIDDEHEQWVESLTPVAGEFGYRLTPAGSVEEGLEMLKEYPGVFDAVILDLIFPGSELQGKDGIIRIYEFEPYLPVLILTKSGSAEDIRTAVECINLGAFDYFPKNALDPHQIFIQVRNSIEQTINFRQRDSFTDMVIGKAKKPYFFVSGSEQGIHTSTFAFQLWSIGIPRNKSEHEAAEDISDAWHKDLITYFQYIDSSITVSLKYIYRPSLNKDKNTIKITILVTIEEESTAKAVKKSELLSKELGAYLQNTIITSSNVYNFLAVTTVEDLLSIIKPLTPKKVVRFIRKSVKKQTAGIGFVQRDVAESKDNTDYKLIPSLPILRVSSTLVDFCSRILEQENTTVFECKLSRTKLYPDEVDLLREISERKSIKNYDLRPDKLESLVDYATRMNDQSGRCFEAEFYLMQESNDIPRPLVFSLIGEIFGDDSEIEIVEIVNSSVRGVNKNRFPHLYIKEEITNLFRLPTPVPGGIPGLRSTHPAREFLPDNLSVSGPYLGLKDIGDQGHSIKIDPNDLRRHMYILGQTGTGKTTILYSMIRDRIKSGCGVGLIDPHGDLWNEVYTSIPSERYDDVIIFDPTNTRNVFGLNLLEYDPRFPEQKTFLINEMFNIFWQLYDFDRVGGPMFEYYMRNAMLLAMDNPTDPGTLLDVVKIFQNPEFRKQLLQRCRNKEVVDFWENEAHLAGGDASLRNISPYITSKLNMFIHDDYVRPVISQKRTEINFRDIIDKKKIVLVKLSKGKLGNIGVKLFGAVLFAKILMAALSRENIPEKNRQDFTLFVDEFQNFTTNSISETLSEARKYRLNLVLANQTLGQLKEGILKTVLGNVGSLVFFRPGIEDYPKIEPYISPSFVREEIINLPNFIAVARLQVNNVPTPPFMFETVPIQVLKHM